MIHIAVEENKKTLTRGLGESRKDKSMSRRRKIISWMLIGLTGALTVFVAVEKLTAGPDAMIVQNFIKWGLEGKLTLIGSQELLIALLFLIPRTSSLGVLLMTAHFSGAIATHLEHGEAMLIPGPALILLIAWIGYYLRYPEMLVSFKKTTAVGKT